MSTSSTAQYAARAGALVVGDVVAVGVGVGDAVGVGVGDAVGDGEGDGVCGTLGALVGVTGGDGEVPESGGAAHAKTTDTHSATRSRWTM